MFVVGKRLNTILLIVLVGLGVTTVVNCYVFRRFHQESETREQIARDFANNTPYDTVGLESYLRSYRHGPVNDRYIYTNHDVIAAYVGPRPPGTRISNYIRAWAMFDKKTKHHCQVDGVFEFGELVLFSCPYPGLYRAYSIEMNSTLLPEAAPSKVDYINGRVVYGWHSRAQKESFSLITGPEKQFPVFYQLNAAGAYLTIAEKIGFILTWEGAISNGSTGGLGPAKTVKVVSSDPVLIKSSYFCYYWMYHLTELDREGYIDGDLVPKQSPGGTDSVYQTEKSYIAFILDIWIAEPSAVGYRESNYRDGTIEVSEYSKVITNRFFTTGLFPCLRKAHSIIEIVGEIKYYRETDLSKTRVERAPHWTAVIKVHTDRLISQLSDVTFTIASRQNTGSFHCFVGDTKVFLNLKNFNFVPNRKLEENAINMEISNIYPEAKLNLKFSLDSVYGHGIHHIGYKKQKRFQPASNRTDMVVIENPCIAQEFAFSVGGSLYIAEGLLMDGPSNAKKVILPYFPDSKRINSSTPSLDHQDFLRVYDVAFTATHVAFLMADGYVILHSTSAELKGLADIKETMKYRPDGFSKRRWCARTATAKLSGMILPIFSDEGNIIILQVYPIEGNVRLWHTHPTSSCTPEGRGFVPKAKPHAEVINETDIHYQEYSKVRRTNHLTGLLEPPVPPRPAPPPPPERDLLREPSYLLDSEDNWIDFGEDPHFPPDLVNPASYVIGGNTKEFNQAVIYVIEDSQDTQKQGLLHLLQNNGLTTNEIHLNTLEFTAMEKTFVYGLLFDADEIPQTFSGDVSAITKPFQMIISTLSVVNFPYRVKIQTDIDSLDRNATDERLDYVSPFPGVILLRSKPYKVPVQDSRDPLETQENANSLKGETEVEFIPQIFPLGTSIPSYVVNLGDVILFTSMDNRYAKPLHYYKWENVDSQIRSAGQFEDPKPLSFEDTTTLFVRDTLYDLVVTEHGIMSVLWRKKARHLVMHHKKCVPTNDSEVPQTVALGSTLINEGLREVKPFFRNDNIFQRGTPDGEIIYGIYNVKPYTPFENCSSPSEEDYNFTISNLDAPCVDQLGYNNESLAGGPEPIQVCVKENTGYRSGCRDPGYIKHCQGVRQPYDHEACLRVNKATCGGKPRYTEFAWRPRPFNVSFCDQGEERVTGCLPKHAPREEISTVDIVGTSYQSYLLGSLHAVKGIHPESLEWEDDVRRQEPDICPFASFDVYQVELDFAEVGYRTRVTGELSYFGTGIPTEADLLVEFERSNGIVVEVSSSVEEDRHLTTIRKTVDIDFRLTDYSLNNMLDVNPSEKHIQRQKNFDFQDVRAREPFTVFSVTLRPSIVNLHCKSTDFFKTVLFNVGCNAHSTMRLISEATPLKRVDWDEALNDNDEFKWLRNETSKQLQLPKAHIYYQQIRKNVFAYDSKTEKYRIPYYHLFRNDIFTISYRDMLRPQFEQFLTVSSRRVTGNVVLYDMLGSQEFNWTINKLDAGCINTEYYWYDKFLRTTSQIGNETFENENLYIYYKNCFSTDPKEGDRENSQNLYVSPFRFFNQTNNNMIKFLRKRNQIFIFRAVALNTWHNRFTYCKTLDTFFMVRVTGIPIPRQGLDFWLYVTIFLTVLLALIVSYVFFSKFYSGIATAT